MIYTLEEIQAQGDFWLDLKDSVTAAGGEPDAWCWEELDLGTFCRVFAPLGFRIVHDPKKRVTPEKKV